MPKPKRFFRIDRGLADVDRAIDDELQFHFDMTVRDLMSRGMSGDEARREAERRFGDVERTRAGLGVIGRERVGKERRAEWFGGLMQDLHYALRGLRLKPGFALAVIATLGLGIGANATMFGIVDRLLFRPPAYLAHPDRVHRLYLARTFDGKENAGSNIQYRTYVEITQNATTLDATAAFWYSNVAVGVGDEAREMRVGAVSGTFWRLFDAKPVIGRFFTADEDKVPEGTPVAVLGYGYWQSKFGGSAKAIGQLLRFGSREYTVIGVAPRGFTGVIDQQVAAFLPISAYASAEFGSNPRGSWFGAYNMRWMEMLVRLKPGVSVAAAQSDLSHAYLASYAQQRVLQPRTTPAEIAKPRAIVASVLRERGPNQGKDAKVAIWLVGVAAIVLIIACANVGNLLLARALRRRREIAVRLALGISRGRLLSQLLTESVLLALLGGVAGVAIAQFGGGVLRRTLIPDVEWSSAFGDVRVLLFASAIALGAGVLTGLAPALYAGRSDLAGTLKAGAREGKYQRSRLRSTLLVLQGALSVVLLVGAGLFVRSLHNVRSLRLGYDAERVAYIATEMRGMKLDSAKMIQLKRRLLEDAKSLAIAENAARQITVPFYMTWNEDLFVAGIDSASKLGDFTLQAASPEYFSTVGTRILRGRGLSTEDRAGAPLVAVISQSMAKKLWPGRDALGQCFRVGADTMPCTTVVGIAEDIKRGSLSDDDMLHYYLPIDQKDAQGGGLFVRTRGVAAPQVETLRRALQKDMPGTSYVTVTPLSDIVGRESRSWQLGATMFVVFGGLALLVAAVGLYSVIAYNVVQRTHELGVRVALGAQSSDVMRLVLADAARVAFVALLLGTTISLGAGRWVKPLLFETSEKDPLVYGAVALMLLAITITASMVPARRAARVDPNEALRAD